jgi:predicted metal-dependent hydrolase
MMDERWRRGIDLFNRAEFFECHEVLEEIWTPERGPRRQFLQAVIHVAVGLYHCRRGNVPGAIAQLHKALRKLAGYLPAVDDIDSARLYAETLAVLERLEAGEEVSDYPRIHPSKKTESFSNT